MKKNINLEIFIKKMIEKKIFKLSNNEKILPLPIELQLLVQSFNQENKIIKDNYDLCMFMLELKSIKYKEKFKPDKFNKCLYCKKYCYSNRKICEKCNERLWSEIG